MKKRISHERLKQVLLYSPIVGVFEWRVTGRKIRPGYLAGCIDSHGYITLMVDGVRYKGHQLAWFYMTGAWPEDGIDHKDGDRSNNAFTNLREADQEKNQANQKISSSNTSGVKGVYYCKATKNWVARIFSHKKIAYREEFETLDAATAGVRAARERLHGEFANHGIHKFEQEELDAG
jgi:hypothetical protein